MSERFVLNVSSPSYFEGIAQVIFHAINKSGSMALENAITEAFDYFGRSSEYLSHYKIGGTSESFYEKVNSESPKFVVAHYLWPRKIGKLTGLIPPFKSDRIWFTQFRHPLPRVLSCHNWLKRKSEKKGESFPSLKEFVINSRGLSHSMVNQFGGEWELFKKDGETRPTSESCFKASIDALENNVHTITIAEKFEESLFLVGRLCNLPSLSPWVRDNRNPGRKLYNEISDEERELIEQVYSYDYMLYDYAIKRFNNQLQQIDFGSNLESYKTACLDQYKDRILI